MNLHEQLKMKKAELAALKTAIANGDAEAIKSGEEIAEAIKNIEAAIKSAEAANSLLNMIGSEDPDTNLAEDEAKDGMKGLIAKAKSVDTGVKGWSVNGRVKSATSVITSPNLPEVDRTIPSVKRVRDFADYTSLARVSANAITYVQQGAVEGDAAVTAQGAKKSQLSTSFNPVTAALKKITAFAKETTELLNDAEFLADVVEDVIYTKIQNKANADIVTTVAGTSGIQSVTYTSGNNTGDAANLVEAILLAKTKIAQATDAEADVVFINPADMYTLMTSKDLNGQYLGGGYFTAAYGTGAYTTPATIWGLPVVESAAVTAGEPLVAAGKEAIKVYRHSDTEVKIFDQNEDDAIYNLLTVRGEKFQLAAVLNKAGVVKISAATA